MVSVIEHIGNGYSGNNASANTPQYNDLKSRLGNQFIQYLSSYINKTSKLSYFCKFKTEFCFEEYLKKIINDNLKNCWAEWDWTTSLSKSKLVKEIVYILKKE